MLTGSNVRLARLAPDDATVLAALDADTETVRMHQSDPAIPASVAQHAAWIDADNGSSSTRAFGIRLLKDDALIGRVALSGIAWTHRHAELGIVLDRAHHGRGHGTEAIGLVLRLAFDELNLHRIGIGVFGTNLRAIRLYERLGFQHEGRAIDWGLRDGQRFDLVHMGLLADTWRTR
jgi:RimJ/RimL family protein N-acetyltransferase